MEIIIELSQLIDVKTPSFMCGIIASVVGVRIAIFQRTLPAAAAVQRGAIFRAILELLTPEVHCNTGFVAPIFFSLYPRE